ncbi:MAG: YfhO family protein [Alistipes sp.]|nr:YfhO family protein [Alistipes sp.]
MKAKNIPEKQAGRQAAGGFSSPLKPGICWPAYVTALLLFLLTAALYFWPQYGGKEIYMHDVVQYRGMSQEIVQHEERYGEDPQWTGAMFGGMPAELIHMQMDPPVLRGIDKALGFAGRPAAYIFLAMAAFFVMLLMFGVDPWTGIIPSLAYGLSTYFFLIIGAGHLAKIAALAYAPLVVGSVAYSFRRNMWLGAALTALFGALELWTNHPQITYYFLFIIAAYWINELVGAVRARTLPLFAKVTGLLAIAGIMALGANTAKLWYVNESGKYSIRGGSELATASNEGTGGLDIEYATAWSYGKAESFNLFIPNFMGGSDQGGFADDGPLAEELSKYGARQLAAQLPAYWGGQPSTVGPTYLGAVMVYLFVLGMFLLCGRKKWWVLAVSVLALMLGWGRNFMFLTELFFNWFPGYNKFRTVSMILAVVEWSVPFLAALVLDKVWKGRLDRQAVVRGVRNSLYLTGGVALFFLLFGGVLFDFISPKDQQLVYYGFTTEIFKAMMTERAAMFRWDCIRSLVFVILTAGAVWLFAADRLKRWTFIAALSALVLVDMVPVNLRYLPQSRFIEKSHTEIRPTSADLEIMADPEPGFRVFNMAVSPFNDATTSYFHRSVGGYHGAKMQRYQDLIDRYLSTGDPQALNMLNTKYFIRSADGQAIPGINPDANGAAWFVDEVVWVDTPDEEIAAIGKIDTKKTAVADVRFREFVPQGIAGADSTARIELGEYRSNYLRYEYSTPREATAVFSEIYYPKGWTAYVDGEEYPHFRADYVLRAMVLPAGSHTVEFRYAARNFRALYTTSNIFSVLILLAVAGAAAATYLCNKNKREQDAREQTA